MKDLVNSSTIARRFRHSKEKIYDLRIKHTNYFPLHFFLELSASNEDVPICVGTIVDDCKYGEPLNTWDNLGDNECHQQCDNLRECKFYTYDSESRNCKLFREPLADFLGLCKTRGNPKECRPPPENCVSQMLNFIFYFHSAPSSSMLVVFCFVLLTHFVEQPKCLM